MTITISHTDPRSIKAVEIAAGAGHWLKCRLADGTKAPSYYVNRVKFRMAE